MPDDPFMTLTTNPPDAAADAATETASDTAPGRSCPLHYRYRPADFAAAPALACDTLYVVGGLYGNTDALAQVLAPLKTSRL